MNTLRAALPAGILLLLVFAAPGLPAADPFVLPKEALVVSRDASGRTWALNGVMKQPLAAVRKTLTAAVLRSGYRLKHEIPLDEKGETHIILAFEKKGRETLILMMWSIDGRNTCFAYGEERK